ncbi:UNVERIFIED_CONTAM: hypothetical protein FKN15_030879 [Acipenser sinensis]
MLYHTSLCFLMSRAARDVPPLSSFRDQAATLSLDEMKVSRWQGGGGVVYDAARRLSTAPDPSKEFHTQYRYYWRDGAGWEEYCKEFSATISSALSMNQPLVSLSSSLHCYFLSLKECFQLNVSTGRRRDLRVRPLFQSPAVLLPQLRYAGAVVKR